MYRIVVHGTPAPQGSKKFVGMSKAGRGILIESSKKVKPWREDVRNAALQVRGDRPPLDGPMIARMVFTVVKPLSAPKTRRTYPMTKPDVSKLCRSTEDALVEAQIILDDARIVGYSRLEKVYPGEDPEALNAPGALIELRMVDELPVTACPASATPDLFSQTVHHVCTGDPQVSEAKTNGVTPKQEQPDKPLIDAMGAFQHACIRAGVDVNGSFAFNPAFFDVQTRLQHLHFQALLDELVASHGVSPKNVRDRFLALIQLHTAALDKPRIISAAVGKAIRGDG